MSRTDAEGRTWQYDYDKDSQQLIGVTAPDGNRWQWWLDADGRVIRERDMAGTETHYGYDEDGHCISVRNGEGEIRHFLYDGRGLLIKETAPDDTLYYRYDAAGRLTQQDNTHYQYDKAGRLIRRQVVQPGYRPQVWHYRWDSRNQLRVVDTPTGERWLYRYDPFGRRIGKRCDQTQDDIRYLWDGDQIAEVRHSRDNQRFSRRHWVHNGWELLVQQRQNADKSWETDFVTSGHNGEPQAVFNPQGELRWQAPRANLWGQRYTENAEKYDPGLAFAGQYRDDESGLCYNRFRYYDPRSGCYISPDPIGGLGVRVITGMSIIRSIGLIRLGLLVAVRDYRKRLNSSYLMHTKEDEEGQKPSAT